jgi:hypothetical protein
VGKSKRYCHHYLDTLDKGRSPLHNMSVQEMYLFLAFIVQMGHNQEDTLNGYWSMH